MTPIEPARPQDASRGLPRRPRRLAVAVLVVAAALALVASASGGQAGPGDPATHPHPVPCAPAPCRPAATAAGATQLMASSAVAKLTITPHVAHVGEIVRMRVAGCEAYAATTRETIGHCLPNGWAEIGDANGRGSALGGINVRCPAGAPGPRGSADFCFKVVDSAFGAPQWYIISASPYACDPRDCLTQDYITIDNALVQLSGTVTGPDDHALAGVRLRAVDRNRRTHSTASDAAGGYVYALPAGKVRVSVLGRDACPASRTLLLRKSRDNVNFTVGLFGRVRLGSQGPNFAFSSVSIGTSPAIGGPRGGGQLSRDIGLTRPADDVTPALLRAAQTGTVFPTAKVVLFHRCKTTVTYILTKATISSTTVAAGTEHLTLSAERVDIR